MLRRGLKHAVEVVLARSGLSGVVSRLRAPSTAILAYHNVVPHGEQVVGDRSLHIDQARFADHLDLVLETHEVVPLDSLMNPGPSPPTRPQAVITFDDGYVGAVTAGAEELARRGLPATIFLPPGLLDAEGFWWDMLSSVRSGSVQPRVRSHALNSLKGRQDLILAWAAEEGFPLMTLPGHARPASREQLLAAAGDDVLRLGSHTWSHANLAALSPAECADEIERGHRWLDTLGGLRLDWLAYPYGLRSAVAVGEAGRHVDGALLIEGGLARVKGNWSGGPHELPRVNVPRGLSADGLALRLAGLR
ncbi:polysaccharide deacetylase family protein [Gemmatimonadota bacterium]